MLADAPSQKHRLAAAAYECHLRYYVEALRFAGFPHAYHTIGSAMAVRPEAYMKQGGMNRRKAEKIFYFLNKIMLLGNFSECLSTVVYPLPGHPKECPRHRSGCFEKHATVPDHHLCLEFLSRNQSHFGLPPATKSLEPSKRKRFSPHRLPGFSSYLDSEINGMPWAAAEKMPEMYLPTTETSLLGSMVSNA